MRQVGLPFPHQILSIQSSLYIMNEISGIEGMVQSVRARDKAAHMTDPTDCSLLTPVVLDGLLHLLEWLDGENMPLGEEFGKKKKEIKFYARTVYLALAISCGDSTTSPGVVFAIQRSSYYLAHKLCLDSSNFANFLSSGSMIAHGQYFVSQQHQFFQNCFFLMHGPEIKVSTPFDFASILSVSFNSSSFANLLECLIDFALTVPESAHLSSEEIFVGCFLLVVEKANSFPLSEFLVNNFLSALTKGGQLTALIKQIIETINIGT